MRSVNRQGLVVAGWVGLVGVDWLYTDVATRLIVDVTGSAMFATAVAVAGRAGLWIALAASVRSRPAQGRGAGAVVSRAWVKIKRMVEAV